MKSLASIFLIITIIYTTIGVSINVHHCDTKNITNYSIFEDNNCCPKEANSCPLHQEKEDCCSDEINLVHLGQDVHFAPNITTPNQLLIAINSNNFSFLTSSTKGLKSIKTKGRAPPLIYSSKTKQALYQVYTI